MKDLFDFDGDGKTDPLEFFIGMGILDSDNPFSQNEDEEDLAESDNNFEYEEDVDYE